MERLGVASPESLGGVPGSDCELAGQDLTPAAAAAAAAGAAVHASAGYCWLLARVPDERANAAHNPAPGQVPAARLEARLLRRQVSAQAGRMSHPLACVEATASVSISPCLQAVLLT